MSHAQSTIYLTDANSGRRLLVNWANVTFARDDGRVRYLAFSRERDMFVTETLAEIRGELLERAQE
jgi:hypothetical protein